MDRSLKRFSILAGFALMAALLIANGVITKHELDRQRGAQDWVTHTRAVLFQIEQIESAMGDAESGQRGYLLTGDDKYLSSYTRAVAEIGPLIDDLERMTADNPTQQKNIANLRGVTHEKLSEMAQTVDVYRSGDLAQAESIVESGEGLVAMDKIRLVLAQMRSEETQLEGMRLASYERSERRTAISICCPSCVTLPMLLISHRPSSLEDGSQPFFTPVIMANVNIAVQELSCHDSG